MGCWRVYWDLTVGRSYSSDIVPDGWRSVISRTKCFVSYQERMDFDHTAADNIPVPREGLAQEEEEKTPDIAVRKAEIESGLSSVATSVKLATY